MALCCKNCWDTVGEPQAMSFLCLQLWIGVGEQGVLLGNML